MKTTQKKLAYRTKKLQGDRFITVVEEGIDPLSNPHLLSILGKPELELEGFFNGLQPLSICRDSPEWLPRLPYRAPDLADDHWRRGSAGQSVPCGAG